MLMQLNYTIVLFNFQQEILSIPFSERKGYTAIKNSLKFVCLSVCVTKYFSKLLVRLAVDGRMSLKYNVTSSLMFI